MSNVIQVGGLTEFMVNAVNGAKPIDAPYHHIEFAPFFPADVYRQIIATMPQSSDYRPMSGRSVDSNRPDGSPTRVKIDLFPEYTRLLPPEKRAVWDPIGRALCSEPLKEAFARRRGWSAVSAPVTATSAFSRFRFSRVTSLAIRSRRTPIRIGRA
jgi:hypothetical protein